MNPLCKVKVVRKPISEGSIVAANGAWNRKYAVFKRDGMLYARLLGSFYADGRVVRPRRPQPFPLKFYPDFPSWKAVGRYGFCEYWHVEPSTL